MLFLAHQIFALRAIHVIRPMTPQAGVFAGLTQNF